MGSIKLTYFGVKGLAEPIRILLKYGGIEFEDDRFEREKWPELKPNTPFGQVPLYEEDGKVAVQSIAIARYVAKKVNLVGDNDWEDLEIDAVVDTVQDLRIKLATYYGEKDEVRQKTLKETLINETIPFYFGRLDKMAAENSGYLVLGKLTWADICLYVLLDVIDFIMEQNVTDAYPNLLAVQKNVCEVPTIKTWIEARPVTDY